MEYTTNVCVRSEMQKKNKIILQFLFHEPPGELCVVGVAIKDHPFAQNQPHFVFGFYVVKDIGELWLPGV